MNGFIATTAVTLVTSLASMAGCDPGPGVPVVETPKAPASVVYRENATIPDLTPPTRLDIIMIDSTIAGGPRVRCYNMGGLPVAFRGQVLCQDVDY